MALSKNCKTKFSMEFLGIIVESLQVILFKPTSNKIKNMIPLSQEINNTNALQNKDLF